MKSRKITDKKHPRVLIVGYNGANNTGAEALLQADIEDVRSVLGPQATITVPTLNERICAVICRKARRCVLPHAYLFFGAISQLVKESDLVLLAEGSTYMDTWAARSSGSSCGQRIALRSSASHHSPTPSTQARSPLPTGKGLRT